MDKKNDVTKSASSQSKPSFEPKDPPTASTAKATNVSDKKDGDKITLENKASRVIENTKKPGAVFVKEGDMSKLKKRSDIRSKYSTLFEGTVPFPTKYPNEEPKSSFMNRDEYLKKIEKQKDMDRAKGTSPGAVALQVFEKSNLKKKKELRSKKYKRDAEIIARLPNEEPRSRFIGDCNLEINVKAKTIIPGNVAEINENALANATNTSINAVLHDSRQDREISHEDIYNYEMPIATSVYDIEVAPTLSSAEPNEEQANLVIVDAKAIVPWFKQWKFNLVVFTIILIVGVSVTTAVNASSKTTTLIVYSSSSPSVHSSPHPSPEPSITLSFVPSLGPSFNLPTKSPSLEPSNSAQPSAQTSWGLDRLDQRELPLDNLYTPFTDNGGEGVRAFIIDTGININHTDFGGRAEYGFNAFEDDPDETNEDGNGHGTHVAGIVGGATWGTAKKVTLISVKVLNSQGGGTLSSLIAGINFVAEERRKDENEGIPMIVHLGTGIYQGINDAIDDLRDAGVIVVIPAGNVSNDVCTDYLFSTEKFLIVGATDVTDTRASWSNYGECLDIFAPGVDITSAWIGDDDATEKISGSSMASSHVCGAAAIFLAAEYSPYDTEALIVSQASRDVINVANPGSPNLLLYVGEITPTLSPAPSLNPSVSFKPTSSLVPSLSPTSCDGIKVRLKLQTDSYGIETRWKIIDQCNNNEIVVEGDEYLDNTEYTEVECIPNGAYQFTIYDSYGDGICCGTGEGSYSLFVNDELVGSGSDFGYSESHLFGNCSLPST